jgi:hypothetical protein
VLITRVLSDTFNTQFQERQIIPSRNQDRKKRLNSIVHTYYYSVDQTIPHPKMR